MKPTPQNGFERWMICCSRFLPEVLYDLAQGGQIMRSVDTWTCVECGKRELRLSSGKNPRNLKGICEECQARVRLERIREEVVGNEKAKNESKSKS